MGSYEKNGLRFCFKLLKEAFFRGGKGRYYSLIACVLFCFLSTPVYSQIEETEIAPPPLKITSKTEKRLLEEETSVKKHTLLALELMDARIKNAEDFNSRNDYRAMFNELGGFHALIDDTLEYLNQHDTDSGKVLNNFKRLEMSLRKFAPRLELIRRNLPLKYETYVRKLIRYVRAARSKAIEPFFDDSIVQKPNTDN